jgi:exonuclease III
MKPKILSWNVSGLNEGNKRLRVSNLLHVWKVDIVCFQEAKLQCLSWSLLRSLWRCNHVDWVRLDSCGMLGGIMILWDKKVVEKIENRIGVYTLAVKFMNIEDGSIWAFAAVYGLNHASDTRLHSKLHSNPSVRPSLLTCRSSTTRIGITLHQTS